MNSLMYIHLVTFPLSYPFISLHLQPQIEKLSSPFRHNFNVKIKGCINGF